MKEEDEETKCQKCCRKFGLILGFIFLVIPDLALDWDFYHEAAMSNNKYFEDNAWVLYGILAFSALGTLIFFLESINLAFEVGWDDPCVSLDVALLFSTWIEDVPQIILALLVAINLSKTITVIQYVKAGYSIFQVIVKILIMVAYVHFGKKRGKKYKTVVGGIRLAGELAILIISVFIIIELHYDNFTTT